ncbi:PspC domain-containing protein [Skermania piniformis]|uniref:PspC domain-containing protein n=2 Tax=Skermania pinensis TaxID=39122 RepID=A0ABX8S622_9ACTN|nr:PspC domain-containing protein [Skermania piniformis]
MGAMTTTRFSDQLHNLWRTRPIRLPDRAPIAGVAAGIGYRYGIDPVLVRVAFVVATIFGGAGLVLYLGAWLCFPRIGDSASAIEALAGRGFSSESRTRSIVLTVAFLVSLFCTGPLSKGSGLIGTVLLLGGWWLLYQRNPRPPGGPGGAQPVPGYSPGYFGPPGRQYGAVPGADRFAAPAGPATHPTYSASHPTYSAYSRLPDEYRPDPAAPDRPTGPPTAASPRVSLTKQQPAEPAADHSPPAEPATSAPTTPAPPAWDPLGVAPFAWDLPDPTPPPPLPVPVTRPRSRLTPIILGLTIIAGAIATGLAIAGVTWFTPARIAAVALVVVGIGLVHGAFRRRGHGLLLVAVPLAGFVVLASAVGPVSFDGSREWRPAALGELQSSYAIEGGGGRLDLRSVNLTADRTVALDVRFGGIQVWLPDTTKVRVNCDISPGECSADDAEGGSSTGTLTLNVAGRFGAVEVRRG